MRTKPSFALAGLPVRALLLLICTTEALLGLASTAAAQDSRTGIIIGRASNEATQYPLNGAQVSIPGTNYSTFTDRDGSFRLVVPAGDRILRVECLGLDSRDIPVQVAGGQSVIVNVKLTTELLQLEKLTVYSTRDAESAALEEERSMVNPAKVASIDAYGIPASDPGDLLQRLPQVTADYVGGTVRGVYIRGLPSNFVELMLDGNLMASSSGTSASRQVQVDQYNTAALQEVEVILEPTPDMDSDAIGGLINLVTRRAYDVAPTLQLTVGTNWIDAQNATEPAPFNPGHPDISLLFSQSFSIGNGKNNLGIEFSFNHNAQNATVQDETDAALVGGAASVLLPGQGGNTSGGPLQSAYGGGYIYYNLPTMDALGMNLDYKTDNGLTFALRTTYNHQVYNQDFLRWFISVPNSFASFLPGSTTQNETTVPTAATAWTYSSNFVKKSVNWSISPEVTKSLFDGSGLLDFSAMGSYAQIWYPGYQDEIAADSGIGFNINRAGKPSFAPDLKQTAGPSFINAASYMPTQYFHYTYGSPDTLVEGRLDYKQSFSAPVPSFVKMGIKYSNEARSTFNIQGLYDSFTGSTAQGIAPYQGYQLVVPGPGGPFPFFNIPGRGAANDPIYKNYFVQTPSDAFTSAASTLGTVQRYQEDLSEGYIEGQMTLGKLTILGGLRVEESNVHGKTYDKTPLSPNSALTAAQNASLALSQFGAFGEDTATYKDVLPGLFLTYEPWTNFVIRGSYNETVTRPPVANLIPSAVVAPNLQTINIGNPNLKSYHAQNFDLSVTQYFAPASRIEVGVFLKEVKDYIETSSYTVGSGFNPVVDAEYAQYPGYTVNTSANFGQARFRGIYADYEEQFPMLPGFLGGFGVFGNATFLETQGNFGTTAFYENLASFTPFSANYGISYARGRIQSRLLANYRGEYVYSGFQPGIVGTVMQLPRTIVSWNGAYAFNRHLNAFFNINNLTNEPTNALTVGGLPFGTLKQGIGFMIGMQYNIH